MPSISLPGIAEPIHGTGPIVVIGPNGVGKTLLGVKLAQEGGGERVGALRHIEVSGIPMQTFAQASEQVKQQLSELLHSHWRQSSELHSLLSEIIAEDREKAVLYRSIDLERPGEAKDPLLTNTRLVRIVRIWNRHFPGRKINIDYAPEVEREMSAGFIAKYPIAQMSEGERTALYLIARVIGCASHTLVVDEPETFFHPILAKNLWDDLEREAPDIRFIYLTHDVPFALSRYGARFVVAREGGTAELLPDTNSIPGDVISDVLGAASFSISASRLIFCEGGPGSLDLPILRAWHNCSKTAIVPVGSCDAVRQCVQVFRAGTVTGGLIAFGYIDRDAWPDSFLNSDPNIFAHTFSEIEAIFCNEAVFVALAKYNRVPNPEAKYIAFLSDAKAEFTGARLHKEVLQRAKLRVEWEQKSLLNPIKTNADMTVVRAAFVNASPVGGWPAYLEKVFAEEEARLTVSHAGAAEEFVRDFPAKTYYKMAAHHLGFLHEKMKETLVMALELTEAAAAHEKSLAELRDALIEYLTPRLLARTV